MVQAAPVAGFRMIPSLQNDLLITCPTVHQTADDPNSPMVLAEDIVVLADEGCIFAKLPMELQFNSSLRALALKKKKMRHTA